MRRTFARTFLLVIVFLLIKSPTEAASLYIDPPRAELNRGDAIELNVRLDIDEERQECVNAIDAVISYSSNIAPVDVSIGESIFSMWVQQPVIDKENRTISFAGGMPNGYCGRIVGDPKLTNSIVKLIFRSPGFTVGGGDSSNNQATVSFTEQTSVYLNDGLGTQVAPQTYEAQLTLSKAAGPTINDPWRQAVNEDTIPPEEFSIFLNREDTAFSGKYYISFNTTDKQTGIDQYQVMEEPIERFGAFDWGRADAPWITVRSPYVLKDQSLNSTIRVRALDKAGNEYIATLLPEESLRTVSGNQFVGYTVYGLIILIVLGCLGVVVAFFLQRLRRREERSVKEVNEDNEDNND